MVKLGRCTDGASAKYWGRVMTRLFFAALALLSALAMHEASARGRCAGSSTNPMVSSESFGVSGCKRHAPRYHTRDHLAERARGYTQHASSDPMVWSDTQWRSSLMGGYSPASDDRYDRRFRREAGDTRDVQVIERIIVLESVPPLERMKSRAKPPAPKRIRVGDDGLAEIIENSSRFRGHRCSGILVLRWGAGGSRARCYNSSTRVRSL